MGTCAFLAEYLDSLGCIAGIDRFGFDGFHPGRAAISLGGRFRRDRVDCVRSRTLGSGSASDAWMG